MAKVTLEKVSKFYGDVEAVKKIDLDINDKEFLVLVGPSGCGKSSTLRMIAGLEEIDQGTINIGAKTVNELEPRERNVSMVFQNYALYPHMTVEENLGFSLKIAGMKKGDIDSRVTEAAGILDIEEFLQRKPAQLSGGQRQRVAMGRAIVRRPDVFLFDEPLSNLDAKLRVEMRREIKKLHQQLKTTVVYVTHDQTEAMSLGTKIAIMNHGVIQQNNSPELIYNKPSNTFVADFIGSPSMNLIKGKLNQKSNKILFTADEANFAIPIISYDFIKASQLEDKEVFFGIRPEHIYFKKSNEDDFEVNLTADLSEYIGHEQIMTFNFANQELLAKFPSTFKIELNKETKLYFDLTQISLFDANSKERI